MACPFARVASALGIQSGSEEAKAAFASSPYHSGQAANAPASSTFPSSSLKAFSGFSTSPLVGKNVVAKGKKARKASTSSALHSTATSESESSATMSPLPAPLSQHLSTGTASAHRQVERSAGVKALMASLSKSGNKELAMGRLDYVRWLIMIDAVYLVMESELLALQRVDTSVSNTSTTPAMLRPFLSHPTLLPTLLRASAIEADIDAHVAALEEETSISLADHVEASALENEDPSSSSSSAAASQEELELKKLVARYRDTQARDYARIDLLTRRQVSATLAYVNRIRHLASLPLASSSSAPSKAGSASAAGVATLFSHAYTRYMGDLSGGQFIKKHIEAKWPCLDNTRGFTFYDFDISTFEPRESIAVAKGRSFAAKMAGEKALKDAFRSAMDEGFDRAAEEEPGLRQRLAEEMVVEGVVAFELNGDLFDALIDSSVQTFAAPSRTMEEVPLVSEQVQSAGKGLNGLTTLVPILLILLASLLLVLLGDSTSSGISTDSLPPMLHRLNSTVKAGLGAIGLPAVAHYANVEKMGL